MQVDLDRPNHFPGEVWSITRQPEMFLWTTAGKSALLVKLTVPSEEVLEASHRRRKAKYTDLIVECRKRGWGVRLHLGGGGCLRPLELKGLSLQKVTRKV